MRKRDHDTGSGNHRCHSIRMCSAYSGLYSGLGGESMTEQTFREFFNIYLVGLGVMAMQRDNGLPSNEGIRFEEVPWTAGPPEK